MNSRPGELVKVLKSSKKILKSSTRTETCKANSINVRISDKLIFFLHNENVSKKLMINW